MKVKQGTVIDQTECPGCGCMVPVKVNSAGCVYFYCAEPTGIDDNGKVIARCLTRLNIGREGSDRMIDQFLAIREEPHAEPTHEQEPAGKPRPAHPIDDGEEDEVTDDGPRAPKFDECPKFSEPVGIGHNGGPPLDDEPAGEPERRTLASWFD